MLPCLIESNGTNAVVEALHGFVVYNKQDSRVGRAIEAYGEFAEGVVSLLRQVCRKGSVVVEVGAQNGAHSLPLAKIVGPTGRIHAIEADRAKFQLLCATMALNSIENVDCYAAQVSGSPASAGVPPVTLDQLVQLDALRLIKVDAGGHEQSVLSGATSLIRQHRPLLLVNNSDPAASRQLIQRIKSLDYQVFWHLTPWFRTDNTAGNRQNVFPRQLAVYLFGYPQTESLALTGFTAATVSDFNPIQLLEWLSLVDSTAAGAAQRADTLCRAISNTAPARELADALLALGVFAYQQDRLADAERLLGWLQRSEADSWPGQFAAAAVRERREGPAAATKHFNEFVAQHPVYVYHQSPQPDALRLATLLTSGNREIRFTANGYKLPEGNTDSHHLTWHPHRTLGSIFVDAIKPEQLADWHVLFNAVSDPDLHADALQRLAAVLQHGPCAIINHPLPTVANTRDVLSQKLQTEPQMIVPKTIRVEPVEYGRGLADQAERSCLRYPLLIRPAGSQTGVGLDRVDNAEELQAYRAEAAAIYLTEFYDAPGDDGYYRKYRCWCVGDQIVANHLFIHSDWKVHGTCRRNTMAQHAWMCQEEQQFLDDLGGERRPAILHLMQRAQQATGLDYVGVDFSFAADGRPMLFEANATMRSYYPEWAQSFPYTRRVLQQHVAAFHSLLDTRFSSI